MISSYIVQGAALELKSVMIEFRLIERGWAHNVNLKAKSKASARANVIEPSRRYPIGFLGFQL